MPYLLIQTNVELPAAKQSAALKVFSKTLAAELGKSEQYVMAGFAPAQRMIFAGSDAPTAFLSLKSINLPEAKLKPLSAILCKLMAEHAGVPASRVYIEFTDAKAKYWGHDGDTFG